MRFLVSRQHNPQSSDPQTPCMGLRDHQHRHRQTHTATDIHRQTDVIQILVGIVARGAQAATKGGAGRNTGHTMRKASYMTDVSTVSSRHALRATASTVGPSPWPRVLSGMVNGSVLTAVGMLTRLEDRPAWSGENILGAQPTGQSFVRGPEAMELQSRTISFVEGVCDSLSVLCGLGCGRWSSLTQK